MSYLGYTPVMVSFLEEIFKATKSMVTILEIGVDKGQTALPLMHNLNMKGIPFHWVGVDIRLDESFAQQVALMEGVDHYYHRLPDGGNPSESFAYYLCQNSLDYLKDQENKFDLVLIDGDHNYDTVTEELSHLDKITHELSLVVCDDYLGQWGAKDSFYSQYETHKDLKNASKALEVDKDKGGVKKAIDEFLIRNAQTWNSVVPDKGSNPIMMFRKLEFEFELLPRVKDDHGRSLFHPQNFVCSWPSVGHIVRRAQLIEDHMQEG